MLSLLAVPPYTNRLQVASVTPVGLAFNGLGGTNGAVPAPTDTGVGNPWDVVQQGTGATLQYDNSQGAAQGCQSLLFATGSTATTSFVRWTASMGSHAMAWFSTYAMLGADPPAAMAIVTPRRDSDAGAAGSFRITTAGLFTLNDASSNIQKTSQSTVPLGLPFRMEGYLVASNGVGGFMELRLFFKPNSSVPDEVLNVGGIQTSTGGQNVSGIRFGVGANNIANAPSLNMWGMQASNVGYPQPLSPTIGLSDSAVGADSIIDSAVVTLTEPATSSDVLVSTATVGLSDSAVSSDTMSDSTGIILSDAASAAEAIVAAVTAHLADVGVGSDTLSSSFAVTLTDSATGVDSIVVSVLAAIGDLGEGVDAVVQYFKLSDLGHGSDSAIVSVTVSLADSGSGADSLIATPVFTVNLSDAGFGTDTLVAIPDNTNTVTLSDSGSGVDSFSVSPFIRLVDTGTGLDTIQITVQMWLGFDDPVPEGHEPFNPRLAAELQPAKEPFRPPDPYAKRTGTTVVPVTWKMTPEQFLAHMHHMHAGNSPEVHTVQHMDGEGGYIRHIHR